jgi:hypothetical protein
MTEPLLSMWVVYDHPTDYPTEYVARRHEVVAGGSRPTNEAMASRDLDMLRDELAGRGLVMLQRMDGDDPKIMETWL